MKMRGDKVTPRTGGTGENTPFAEQSKEKEAGQWSQHYHLTNVQTQFFKQLLTCLVLF